MIEIEIQSGTALNTVLTKNFWIVQLIKNNFSTATFIASNKEIKKVNCERKLIQINSYLYVVDDNNFYLIVDENLNTTGAYARALHPAKSQGDFAVKLLKPEEITDRILLNGKASGFVVGNMSTLGYKVLEMPVRSVHLSADQATILVIGENKITVMDNPLI